MAVGDLITAARYNNAQARVAAIMGVGSTTEGYGQTLNSSQVSTALTVTAAQVNALYADLVAGTIHQTGSTPTTIAEIVVGNSIADATSDNPDGAKKGFQDYEDLITIFEADPARFAVAASQTTNGTGVTSTRTAAWNTDIAHVVRVDFTTADARRNYFNAGGTIKFEATLASAGDAKSNDWASMLSNMGTIAMGYTATTSTGTGTVTSIGNFDLTSSNQVLFRKPGTGVYSANDYYVYAKANSATQLEFTLQFQEEAAGNPNFDEQVNGTLVNSVKFKRPSGSYVTLPAPSFVTVTSL
jgi:hypothetical protein|tara:strand:+ start:1424 stop:2320 length:897 start_codon:yes stop_codon:yes gene_type:complete